MSSGFTKKEGIFLSSNGKTNIYYFALLPENKPIAVIQFMHGMAEHSERYVEFGKYLALNGIAFYIADFLGHGKSVDYKNELGFLGKKSGWKHMVEDSATLTKIIRIHHKDIPLITAGHSMGSFVCRAYVSMYPENMDAALFLGTANADLLVKSGIFMADLIRKIRGSHFRPNLLDKLSFGSYNKIISNPATKFDWLSTDADIVKTYCEDNLCGFVFTADGFKNVSALMSYVSTKRWLSSVKKELPVLIIAGKDDPVGKYGADVVKLEKVLKEHGVKSVRAVIYENMRHEILNEKDKQKVYDEILSFIKSQTI